MGDTYDRVREKTAAVIEFQRAAICLEMMNLLWKSSVRDLEQRTRYIHILDPVNQLSDKTDSDWSGQLSEIKRLFKEQQSSMIKKQKELYDELAEDISQVSQLEFDFIN